MPLNKVARKLPNTPFFPSPTCFFVLLVSSSKKLTFNQVHVF
jgi:hypothetical protein